jgi:hypothetical protein
VAQACEYLRVADKRNIVKEANVDIGRMFLKIGVTRYSLHTFSRSSKI